jgi:VanZ family protein
MPIITPHNRSTPWGLFLLSAAMLVLILYSGLHFKGASGANDVSWLGDQAGLRFGPQGIVHGPGVVARGDGPISIAFAVEPGEQDDGHFRLLLLLHGGNDEDQLVIGQWRSWLVVMNGDDYDARRRRARITVDVLQPHRERFVVVTSDHQGTTVFIDGQRAGSNTDLHLKIPGTGADTKLVLGNSVYGRHPWAGSIYGLAFFDRMLSPQNIAQYYGRWKSERQFAFARSANPSVLYLFDEGKGATAADHAGSRRDLTIPATMTILVKEFLTASFGPREYQLYQDMIINILGFIPMGFLLSALMWHAGHRTMARRLLVVMLVCGIISLAIELAQAWIPTRSSQLLDWILNTLGGGAGVLFHRLYVAIFGTGLADPTNP